MIIFFTILDASFSSPKILIIDLSPCSLKLFITSCEEYQNSPSEDKLKSLKQDLDIACSKVDKAKNQGILHKNTAMRKKSTLQSIYNKLFVKSI